MKMKNSIFLSLFLYLSFSRKDPQNDWENEYSVFFKYPKYNSDDPQQIKTSERVKVRKVNQI